MFVIKDQDEMYLDEIRLDEEEGIATFWDLYDDEGTCHFGSSEAAEHARGLLQQHLPEDTLEVEEV